MTRQCLERRIPEQETLEQETTAWETQRNHSQKSALLAVDNGRQMPVPVLCGYCAQIGVIKPHSAVLNFIWGVLDRYRWDSRIDEGARPQ
jgi:hypothetical protein